MCDARESSGWRAGRFERRTVAIEPGQSRSLDDDEWRDTIVVVERGELEIECHGGSHQRFVRGDVLWLVGLSVRELHNRGRQPVVLLAVRRRQCGR